MLEYDKLIAENPDDEKAQKAADKLFDLAKEAEPDSETAEQLVIVAFSLDNPNDEITVSELSGHRLASLISELLENPNLPKTFEKFLCMGLNEMYYDFPLEIQQKLDEKEDFSTEYLTELFRCDKENPSKKEAELKEYWKQQGMEEKGVLDLSEVCTEFLGTNEATAGEKRVSLAVLLSAVMKHPDMPTQIYNVLSDELCEIPEDFYEQPETIQHCLDVMREKETEG